MPALYQINIAVAALILIHKLPRICQNILIILSSNQTYEVGAPSLPTRAFKK